MTLSALATIVFTVDVPTPGPTYPAYTGDVNLVTPGVLGFIAIAVIAVATILLIVDMTKRIRRVRYRAEVQEKLAAEAAGTATAPEG